MDARALPFEIGILRKGFVELVERIVRVDVIPASACQSKGQPDAIVSHVLDARPKLARNIGPFAGKVGEKGVSGDHLAPQPEASDEHPLTKTPTEMILDDEPEPLIVPVVWR